MFFTNRSSRGHCGYSGIPWNYGCGVGDGVGGGVGALETVTTVAMLVRLAPAPKAWREATWASVNAPVQMRKAVVVWTAVGSFQGLLAMPPMEKFETSARLVNALSDIFAV